MRAADNALSRAVGHVEKPRERPECFHTRAQIQFSIFTLFRYRLSIFFTRSTPALLISAGSTHSSGLPVEGVEQRVEKGDFHADRQEGW